MINFKDFYKKTEQVSEDTSTEPGLATNVALGVNLLVSSLGISSLFSNSQQIEKFSQEVASYATGDDVISSVSEQIGQPRENETEEEFVERASQVLREILKKKFKI